MCAKKIIQIGLYSADICFSHCQLQRSFVVNRRTIYDISCTMGWRVRYLFLWQISLCCLDFPSNPCAHVTDFHTLISLHIFDTWIPLLIFWHLDLDFSTHLFTLWFTHLFTLWFHYSSFHFPLPSGHPIFLMAFFFLLHLLDTLVHKNSSAPVGLEPTTLVSRVRSLNHYTNQAWCYINCQNYCYMGQGIRLGA